MTNKRITSLILAVMFLLSCIQVTYADAATVTAAINYRITMKVDNQDYCYKDETTQKYLRPIIYEGRSYLPIKAVGDALGYDIKYDGATRTIIIDKNAVVATKDSNYRSIEKNDKVDYIQVVLVTNMPIKVDGKNYTYTDPQTQKVLIPLNYENRVYLPVKAMTEIFGATVDYNSTTKTILLTKAPITKLAVPTNFKAALDSNNKVVLTWDKVENATGYAMYEKTKGSIGTTEKLTYTDTNVEQGKTYVYTLRALNTEEYVKHGNDEKYKVWSNATQEVTITTNPNSEPVLDVTTLQAPANLQATPVSSKEINLKWDYVNGATGYKIYKNDSLLTKVETITYNVKELDAGKTYKFYVVAYNSDRESEKSNVASATTQEETKLEAPTNLVVTVISSTKIDLKWDKVSGAEGYRIYKDGSVLDKSITTSYNLTGLIAGTEYKFNVVAYNLNKESEKSRTAIAMTTTENQPPTSVTITSPTENTLEKDKSINVAWTKSTDSEGKPVYYWITPVYLTKDSETYKLLKSEATINKKVQDKLTDEYSDYLVGSAKKLKIDIGVDRTRADQSVNIKVLNEAYDYLLIMVVPFEKIDDKGTQYYLKTTDGTPKYAYKLYTLKQGITQIAAPQNLRTTNITSDQVDLAWDKVSGAAKYTVYKIYNNGANVKRVGDVESTKNTCSAAGLTPSTKYQFYVISYDQAGQASKESNIVDAATLQQANTIMKVYVRYVLAHGDSWPFVDKSKNQEYTLTNQSKTISAPTLTLNGRELVCTGSYKKPTAVKGEPYYNNENIAQTIKLSDYNSSEYSNKEVYVYFYYRYKSANIHVRHILIEEGKSWGFIKDTNEDFLIKDADRGISAKTNLKVDGKQLKCTGSLKQYSIPTVAGNNAYNNITQQNVRQSEKDNSDIYVYFYYK